MNPGGVSDPQGERRKHRTETMKEGGGRGWLRVLGGGERACAVCVQKSSVQILGLCGLNPLCSGVCLAPGFITVAVRCSRL